MSSPRHRIVAIDGWVKVPDLNFDHETTTYPSTDPEDLPERMKDATIIMTSVTRVTRAGIENAPSLQLIACNGTGTDHVDQDAVRERGITLVHVPAQNTDSVSEHAFALYYSVRRKILPMHNLTMDSNIWTVDNMLHKRFGAPPRTNAEETLVVIGYGALGPASEFVHL